MGNLLAAPITEKETHRGQIHDLQYGISSMQGWRVHMEDAHICQETLCAEQVVLSSETRNQKDQEEEKEPVEKREFDEGTKDQISSDMIEGTEKDEGGGQAKKARVNSQNSLADADNTQQKDAYEPQEQEEQEQEQRYTSIPIPNHSLFAVFDGHGGSFAAEYAGLNFVRVLSRQPSFVQYAQCLQELTSIGNATDTTTTTATTSTNESIPNDAVQHRAKLLRQALQWLEMALTDAFLDMDTEIYHALYPELYPLDPDVVLPPPPSSMPIESEQPPAPEELLSASDSGTTANVVLFTPHWIVCANAGDSRSVYSKLLSPSPNAGHITTPLSYDHKPDEDDESQRIQEAGGFVRAGRVDGDLAVSRGLGDFRFKRKEVVLQGTALYKHSYNYEYAGENARARGGQGGGRKRPPPKEAGGQRLGPEHQKVSPVPDLVIQNRNALQDEFVLMACDGIWDVCTNQEGVDLTRDIFQEGESDLGLVCEEILDTCLIKGSKDNMTALVVKMPAQTIGQGEGVEERRRLREEAQQAMEQNTEQQ